MQARVDAPNAVEGMRFAHDQMILLLDEIHDPCVANMRRRCAIVACTRLA